MDMEWDYQYYQPWSDNEWLLQELMDDNTRMEKGEEHNNKSYKQLSYRQEFWIRQGQRYQAPE